MRPLQTDRVALAFFPGYLSLRRGAQWSALVHLIGAWYCGRNHQAPSHKGERGGVADLHAVFVAAWSNSSNDA